MEWSWSVFLFVQPEVRAAAFERLARLPVDAAWLLAEYGGKQVFVNHPVGPGEMTFAEYVGRR